METFQKIVKFLVADETNMDVKRKTLHQNLGSTLSLLDLYHLIRFDSFSIFQLSFCFISFMEQPRFDFDETQGKKQNSKYFVAWSKRIALLCS
ncbi:hypothetical protein NC651_036765 [Populus alba x Populus x berolinensis]|nr:hypothetical protein NC651_036755 [Populus alba x Populus x berolinensis]KAJ6860474.1 hypothetical protein NC651_036765 [Populus alba x Populus x berolinensis]